VTNIEVKVLATGEIKPVKEIEAKPEVPGIVDAIYVKEGDEVVKGQKLARIRVIADPVLLYQTMADMQEAKVQMDFSNVELKREKYLLDQKVVGEKEYNTYLQDYNLKNDRYMSLQGKLELVKNGSSSVSAGKTNVVYASAAGLIVNIPVREGQMVIESNAFNSGTTICSVANMQKLMFEGNVDESEVGKIRKGMEMSISVGAIEKTYFSGKLDYISEKGEKVDGNVKFQIRGQVFIPANATFRIGYSATAECILAHKENILAIDESLLGFEKGKAFIEVESSPGVFHKQFIETGISDGIMIEVITPIPHDAKIKVRGKKEKA
jgi:HlyD family secretion protein